MWQTIDRGDDCVLVGDHRHREYDQLGRVFVFLQTAVTIIRRNQELDMNSLTQSTSVAPGKAPL
jgi:hypothetical protein